jgi:large subunit ribosomal protein L21
MIGDGADISFGAPLVAGALVAGELLEQRKGDKVKVFKKRRRNTYRRKNGHRQHESVVRITSIAANGKTATAKDKAEAPPKRARAKKAQPSSAEA